VNALYALIVMSGFGCVGLFYSPHGSLRAEIFAAVALAPIMGLLLLIGLAPFMVEP
jgi:hypothetical protein